MIDFKKRIAELSTKAGREAQAKKTEENKLSIAAKFDAKAMSQRKMALYLYVLMQDDPSEFIPWEANFITNMERSTSREEFLLTDKQDAWLTKLFDTH